MLGYFEENVYSKVEFHIRWCQVGPSLRQPILHPKFYFMRQLILLILACLTSLPLALAQSTLIKLWPEGVPNCPVDSAYRVTILEERGRKTLAVQEPEIEGFLPPAYRANGTAVLICPGGGYYLQAYDWEGTEVAKWFNRRGVAAFVLKYRLPHWSGRGCSDHIALDDATRAMRLIRSRASEFNVDPERVGVMGFSAGGHLASTLSTHYDRGTRGATNRIDQQASRPDFSILIYPVITGDTAFSHRGSFRNLLKEDPPPSKVEYYSSELQVDADTPPTFLLHAFDDKSVPPENSIRYFQALQREGVPAALHIFSEGGHGFSMAEGNDYLNPWLDLLDGWMKKMALLGGEKGKE